MAETFHYIKLEDAIQVIRVNGILGAGYSTEEREDDVISLLETLPFVLMEDE